MGRFSGRARLVADGIGGLSELCRCHYEQLEGNHWQSRSGWWPQTVHRALDAHSSSSCWQRRPFAPYDCRKISYIIYPPKMIKNESMVVKIYRHEVNIILVAFIGHFFKIKAIIKIICEQCYHIFVFEISLWNPPPMINDNVILVILDLYLIIFIEHGYMHNRYDQRSERKGTGRRRNSQRLDFIYADVRRHHSWVTPETLTTN